MTNKAPDEDDDLEEALAAARAEFEMGIIPRDISEAPAEEQTKLVDILNAGQIHFAPGVKEQMEKLGLTQDDIIAGMLGALNRKN